MSFKVPEREAVVRLSSMQYMLSTLPDNCVDIIFTDPDYGIVPVGNTNGSTIRRKHDWMGDINQQVETMFKEFYRVLKPGGHCVTWCRNELPHLEYFQEVFTYRGLMYWWKTNPMPCSVSVTRSMETAMWGTKGKGYTFHHINPNHNIVRTPRVPTKFRFKHPTVKSEDAMSYFIEKLVNPGDTLFDPFCGTGSIPLAGVKLGLNIITCDINSEWSELTFKRLREVALDNLSVNYGILGNKDFHEFAQPQLILPGVLNED